MEIGSKTAKISWDKRNGLHLIALLIIWSFGLYYMHITTTSSIRLVGDEFGYWSAGAWMAGIDWKEVASINFYFGYGYGIFLAPILLLPITQTLKYQIAIVLNIMFVCMVYMIIYLLLNKVSVKMSTICKVLIALCVTLYASNIFFIQLTMPEVLILLLYWGIVYFAYQLLTELVYYKVYIYITLLVYSFSVHQRMIGIVFVGAIFLIYLLKRNKKKIQSYIGIGLFFTLLFLVVIYLKSMYRADFLSYSIHGPSEVNNLSGQIDKLQKLLTISGIKDFLIGFLGKIYYACSSSYLLVPISVTYFLKILYINIKKKKINDHSIMIGYLILNFIIMMAIDTIFMIDYRGRFDLLLYGRYFEFTLGPLLVLGLIILFDRKIPSLQYIWIFAIYEVLTIFIDRMMPYDQSRSHIHINCVGIYDVLKENRAIYAVNVKIVLIFTILISLAGLIIKKEQLKMITYILVCSILVVCWGGSSYSAYKNGFLSWTNISIAKEEDLAELIEEMNIKDLYYYVENTLNIYYLQFLLGSSPIKCLNNISEIDQLPYGTYVLTINSTNMIEESQEQYEKIANTDLIILWKKDSQTW